MAQITLNSHQIDFIRQALIFVERHYTEQIALDRSLLSSSYIDSEPLFERFLKEDTECLEMAKSLYSKFLGFV